MSCQDFKVCDEYEIVRAFVIRQVEKNGRGHYVYMRCGERGIVRDVLHPSEPGRQSLSIFWPRLKEKLDIPEEEFPNLKKLD